ncbi:MAG TPA: ABC transporter ATP-binding protein [Thermodesulfobacteriota bacterium]|nr:ABC transporter ATP-binding protein [Thermodesulfobacteriota bacterium]
MSLLEIGNLEVVFPTMWGTVRAVHNVNFSQESGETVGLVGESGAGKTMLGRSLMGFIPFPGRVEQGRILWKGEDLLKKTEREMRRIRSREIAMVFQDPISALNPLKKIGDQLVEAILLHQNLSRAEARELSIRRMGDVGIPRPEISIENFPHQYSGGMLQRIVIALALINDPLLVIADEPTTALDVTIQSQILQLLKDLQAARKLSILMITHNLGIVAQFCSRIYVMYAGKMVEHADTRTLFHRPLHPYTRGLLRSVIRLDQKTRRVETLAGLMPDLIHMPTGCAFQPRCNQARDVCRRGVPEWRPVEDRHWVACFEAEG